MILSSAPRLMYDTVKLQPSTKLIIMTIWNLFWTLRHHTGPCDFLISSYNFFRHYFILLTSPIHTLDLPKYCTTSFPSSIAFNLSVSVAALCVTYLFYEPVLRQLQGVPALVSEILMVPTHAWLLFLRCVFLLYYSKHIVDRVWSFVASP